MTLESCSKTESDASRPSFLSTVVGTSNFRRRERKGGRLVAGRLLFRLLSALVASTGMTTFGEILSLRHGTSSRETPDIKDGITFPTVLTRDVAISLLHGLVDRLVESLYHALVGLRSLIVYPNFSSIFKGMMFIVDPQSNMILGTGMSSRLPAINKGRLCYLVPSNKSSSDNYIEQH
ncbi:hypothetical protein PTKIN_Ptkin13bG0256600 [Pterospermum kingtungense]